MKNIPSRCFSFKPHFRFLSAHFRQKKQHGRYLALVKVEYTLGSMHRQSLSFNYLVHALIRAQQCPCKRSLALKKPVGGLQPGQR